jgi:predicted  nucleic acid-binding Zn-ribbon protein
MYVTPLPAQADGRLPKLPGNVIFDLGMNNRVGTIVLILMSVGLVIALILSQKHASTQRNKDADSITYYSNQWVQSSVSLDQLRQVNTSLEGDLKNQREVYTGLTNAFTDLSANLEKTEASLKSTREEVARRDTKIADLESQNQALDQRSFELSAAITNLTTQIDDTKRKLAASEGDKAFLEKELERLMAEKAELERQFNDLSVLRAQVAKLKEELNISRRLEWIRLGLFARADQKGAEALMQKSFATNRQAKGQPSYDLNVEVSSDGTVRVIPPLTNRPPESSAATSPPAP